MDFYLRKYEAAWFDSRSALARFVTCAAEELVFMENATQAMNQLADAFPLSPGDEVLTNDHEYEAVIRVWQRACERADATPPIVVDLPKNLSDPAEITSALFERVTSKTKLIIVSHITSSSAILFPVAEICAEARRQGIAICVDGPHAPVQAPLSIESLGCDFYTASCHKWLSAPFGTGFLYVAPQHHHQFAPSQLSWGRLPPTPRLNWADEFVWPGTRDPTSYFSIPTAIEFIESVGMESFRTWSHQLAQYARQRLEGLFNVESLTPDSEDWYGSMVSVPLPDSVSADLQQRLWANHQIEVPLPHVGQRNFIRVSCHLYNRRDQIDFLCDAIEAETK